MLRFILNYLGNRSVALAPDVPLHALRPVSINCPAPSAKYVASAQSLLHKGLAGHTSSSSYISQPYTAGLIQGCTLTQYLEYQQVRYDAYAIASNWHSYAALARARNPTCTAACRRVPLEGWCGQSL